MFGTSGNMSGNAAFQNNSAAKLPIIGATYEIESTLGSGGCGAVYKAWHKRLRKYLVLKELKGGSEKSVEARRNEIEALKNIKNMHIPQVFDFISEDEASFTVMEYIEGKSLDKLLEEGAVFDAPTIIKWYYQLSTTLETLHRNNVCHRDIKPANIIRMPGGDVCLIDFNSALVTGNNTRIISRSPGYASPEQNSYFKMCDNAKNKGSEHWVANIKYPRQLWVNGIDWKLSDIYSLGATMYHLFTGNRPPAAPYISAEPRLLVGEAAAPHSFANSGIITVIERSMHPNPSMRYPSATTLSRALLELYQYC